MDTSVMNGSRSAARTIAIFSWMMIGAAHLAWAEELQIASGESKMVYVGVSKVELHSGPSEDYYPTAILPRNQSLEVYHRTSEGWLGVRPPEGSFSWIPAKDAYLLPGGRVIEITSDSAVSWIGSELGTAKQYRWQVELNLGEQLAVLGESTQKSKDGRDALWYKIAPPAGEFRWIHESAVRLERAPEEKSSEPARIVSDSAKPLPGHSVMERSAASSENGVGMVRNASGESTENVEPTTDRQGSSKERTANDRDGTAEHDVRLAAGFQDDVFGDAQPLRPAPRTSRVRPAERAPVKSDPWDGWHAFDLSDDGLRFTWLERLLKNAPPQTHDPLNHDPFDLSMASRPATNHQPPPTVMASATSASAPASATSASAPVSAPSRRRDRPWRDPRTLRENRLGGGISSAENLDTFYADRPYAGPGRIPGSRNESPTGLVASIREGVAALGQSFQDSRSSSADGSDSLNSTTSSGQGSDYYVSTTSEAGGGLARLGDPPAPRTDDIQWYGVSSERAPLVQRAEPAEVGATASLGGVAAGELKRLQVELSEMVALPPSQWNLKPMTERAKYLIEYGPTPIERGQARLLLERIEEFDKHADRTAMVTSGVVTASYSRNALTSPSTLSNVTTAGYPSPSAAASGSSNFQSANSQRANSNSTWSGRQPYDATGWLVPVHATTPGQPSHALTDDSGRIMTYISALPGMNLRTYVNQPIGVIGLRGYLPQLQAAHIQAQRVIPLR